MNLIQFMIAVFIVVWLVYLLCGQMLDKQEKRLISNAIADESGKHIKIYLNNNTKEEK